VSKPKQTYQSILAEERRHLIAQAAYFRAERRGFQGGCPIQDWLEAEREVSQRYAQPAPPRGALVFLSSEAPHFLLSQAPEEDDASGEALCAVEEEAS